MIAVTISTRHVGIDGQRTENADIPRGTVRLSGAGFAPGDTVEIGAISPDGSRSGLIRANDGGAFSVDMPMPKAVADYYDDIPQIAWQDAGNVWAARVGQIKLIVSCADRVVRGESADTIRTRVLDRWR